MRITLAAIGKMKASPQQELMRHYFKILPWQVTIREIDIKKKLDTPARKLAEAEQLLAACNGAHRIIVLDERGKTLGSQQLATQVSDWQQQGDSHIACIIGGQDGLDASVRKRADLTLSFGAMTWPHMLVRAMLAEQLYRTHTILTGHPYHRE